MRFGLIGFGAWGKFHAEAIRKAPGAELAAIACAGEASAEAAHRGHVRGARIHRDWRQRSSPIARSRRSISSFRTTSTRKSPSRRWMRARTCCLRSRWRARSPVAIASSRRCAVAAAGSRSGTSSASRRNGGSSSGSSTRAASASRCTRMSACFRFPYRQGSGGWRYGRETVGSRSSRSRCISSTC